MQEKHDAFRQALEELYARYPVPGNPDNKRKALGIHRANSHRHSVLDAAARGAYWHHPPNHLGVPQKQVEAIHALIFG